MIFLFVIGIALWLAGRRIRRREATIFDILTIEMREALGRDDIRVTFDTRPILTHPDEDHQALQRTLAQIQDLQE